MADLDPNRLDEQKATELQSPIEYNEAVEARVRRKLDWNLMPLFFVLYMLAFLDRSNIGNAVLAGMTRDLHLVGDRYEWLLTIFYITYVVFEFSLLFWKIFPPHRVAAVVVFCWGVMATLQSAVHNWSGLMALRFFLGAFEAAYAPGVIYLLSFFYLRHEVGFRCGMFASAAPLASTFAGALAYGITSGHSSLSNWRLLFLVEGLPTILLAPIAFFFIPDSPDNARFLNLEEKAIAKSRAVRQTGKSERIGGVSLKELAQTLYDAKAWCYALMYFSVNVSYASLPVYLPTILAKMGYSSINAQGLSAPPYFAAYLFANITTFIADRTQQRGLVLITTSLVGGIGYIVLATVTTGVVMAAVRVFYMRVMNDEMLRPFFEDIDLARLKNKLVSFLAYAFGGGVGHQLNFQPRYKGRDLAFMHSHMVEKGLTMDHFDAVLKHFCQTLRQLNMPQSAIDEASANLNKTRAAFKHVIDKAKDPEKDKANFISSDLIANMQGDKAALLAEVHARMVANPELAKGVGLEPIDPNDPDLHRPVTAPMGSCPFSDGQAQTLKGRPASSGLCPMGH